MINVLKINCGLLPIQIDPECYEWGLSARSVDMMKSILGNDKQIGLIHYSAFSAAKAM